jgi:hypothetical protein
MRSLRKAAIVSVVLMLAAASMAWGQAAVTVTAKPAAAPTLAGPILDTVPAGTLGFVAIRNVGRSFTAVQDYLKAIGVSDLAPIPPDLLAALKDAAQLGDGFNADGGFAAAMLDPQPFGIDFLKMIKDADAPSEPNAAKPKVPFVLFVPASGLKEVFGKYEMKAEGDLTHITFRSGEGYAAMMGGYAIVSPNAKAVQAVLKADKKASSELSKETVEAMLTADVAFHVNLKVAGPTIKGLLDMVAQQAKDMPRGAMPFAPEQMFGMIGKMIAEMRELTMTIQLGKTGLIFQEYLSLDPAGSMGKAMAAFKPVAAAGLDRLPDLPYVLAFGAMSGPKNPMNKEFMDMLVKAIPGVTDETRAKIVTLQQNMEDQVTGMQLVLGGAPEGAGVFGLGAVISCKDSVKAKGLLGDAVETIMAVVAGVTGSTDSPLKVAYVKDAQKLDGVSLDAITITHPKFAEMTEDDKAGMKKVLGEDKIRILVAAPDDKTVVVTFGGSTAMMTEALKAAKGGGTIPKDAGVVEIMKYMPKNPQAIIVLDAAHLLAAVRKGAEALGVGGQMPPIQVTCKTPIAIGAGISGDTVHEVFFVPNDLVKDILNTVKTFMGIGGASSEVAPSPAAPLQTTPRNSK